MKVREYQVSITTKDYTTEIDVVTAPYNYSPEQYILDCIKNADIEWVDFIRSGTITLTPTN